MHNKFSFVTISFLISQLWHHHYAKHKHCPNISMEPKNNNNDEATRNNNFHFCLAAFQKKELNKKLN
jgi:hypothetical protein